MLAIASGSSATVYAFKATLLLIADRRLSLSLSCLSPHQGVGPKKAQNPLLMQAAWLLGLSACSHQQLLWRLAPSKSSLSTSMLKEPSCPFSKWALTFPTGAATPNITSVMVIILLESNWVPSRASSTSIQCRYSQCASSACVLHASSMCLVCGACMLNLALQQ